MWDGAGQGSCNKNNCLGHDNTFRTQWAKYQRKSVVIDFLNKCLRTNSWCFLLVKYRSRFIVNFHSFSFYRKCANHISNIWQPSDPLKWQNYQCPVCPKTKTVQTSVVHASFLIPFYCRISTILNGSMEKQFTRILFVRIAEPCKNEQKCISFRENCLD